MLRHLAQVCGAERRSIDIAIDCTLHLRSQIEDTALVGENNPELVERRLPIRGREAKANSARCAVSLRLLLSESNLATFIRIRLALMLERSLRVRLYAVSAR
jgi:hypothetical protein